MATSHYEEATKILAELEPIVIDGGGDAQVKAIVALTNAVLAAGNELSLIKTRIPAPPRSGPLRFGEEPE